MLERLEAVLGPERSARLRALAERLREEAGKFSPRDWALLAAGLAAVLFIMQGSRLMSRQTRLLERQTDLLAALREAAALEGETARHVARARLRAALWRVQELLRPAALRDAAALGPDRRGALVREARLILEDEEFNPALAAEPESARAWQSALAAARLAEETAGRAEADAGFFLMQAERVRRDVLAVRERLGETVMPEPPPAAPAPPAASSPLPKPAEGMAP